MIKKYAKRGSSIFKFNYATKPSESFFQKKAFSPVCVGASFADTFPPFPDGTIFINLKKEKSRWLIVDDGELQSFDGKLSKKPMEAIQFLNKLSTEGKGWATCKDIEVIFTSVEKIRITEI
ncbi:hypothetical protein [Vibrio sp. 10N.222.49.B4]|uniref:hypothetical protein n=1 Tax=Vibrio sp. 10N.222.49.B4 TaxID=3229613 RepID=UPI0035500F73